MTSLFLLKREPTPTPVHLPADDERKEDGRSGLRIRCPRCAWEPGRDDRWLCSCLHSWNTFDTRGVCPACERQWLETQCLRCNEWSRHDDWYVDESEHTA